MDEDTKVKALDKLSKMDQMVAYPDEILDEELVAGEYANVIVKPGRYFDNAISIGLNGKIDSYNELRKAADPDDWRNRGYVSIVNAFYSFQSNSIMFPAGILGGTMFDADAPPYLNYGAIGVIIGHEITHGYDDHGRTFDADGNLNNWWDENTAEKYKAKAQCIIDQFSGFKVDQVGKSLNGINTQGENIADAGGIQEAYLAFEAYIAKNGEPAILPGHPYTPRQLFWIGYGRSWCSKLKDEILDHYITIDSHSPAEWRVKGGVMNSPFFAKDFNCPVGSPMNPEAKCSLW